MEEAKGRCEGVKKYGGYMGECMGKVCWGVGEVGRDVGVWKSVGSCVLGFSISPRTLPHISLHLPTPQHLSPHPHTSPLTSPTPQHIFPHPPHCHRSDIFVKSFFFYYVIDSRLSQIRCLSIHSLQERCSVSMYCFTELVTECQFGYMVSEVNQVIVWKVFLSHLRRYVLAVAI